METSSTKGLKLGDAESDSIQLAIAGYQFPHDRHPLRRYSWYIVEGEATANGRWWNFRWQALTCDDAPRISEWLRQLANWSQPPLEKSAPPAAPWLIEPNIQFQTAEIDDTSVIINATLDIEFLPPAQRRARRKAASPLALRIRTDADSLLAAADGFDATIDEYPVWPSPARRPDVLSDQALWTVTTIDGGLIALKPEGDRPALSHAIQDCVETLSPAGQPVGLSTYWIDLMLMHIMCGRDEVAHGNLWVFTLRQDTLELRMDVDPLDSAPLDTLPVDDMLIGLEMLRGEVLERMAAGHRLDRRRLWLQRNP